jgi:ribosomal protein L32
MPNPKRKLSKTRRDKRRTHYKATAKNCVQYHEHHLPSISGQQITTTKGMKKKPY